MSAADLLAALVGPDLDGAACTGLAPAFDTTIDGETDTTRDRRLTTARAVCQHCPVRDRCADAATELPRSTRTGLWAGVLFHARAPRGTDQPDSPDGATDRAGATTARG